MPLIIITGMPCTGKTQCFLQIQEYFNKLKKPVVLVSEHDYIKVRGVIIFILFYCASQGVMAELYVYNRCFLNCFGA